MHAKDTTPEAAAIQEAAYRQLGPHGRFQIAAELTNVVRELAQAGIRKRHPDYTPEQVSKQLARQIYGLSADADDRED